MIVAFIIFAVILYLTVAGALTLLFEEPAGELALAAVGGLFWPIALPMFIGYRLMVRAGEWRDESRDRVDVPTARTVQR